MDASEPSKSSSDAWAKLSRTRPTTRLRQAWLQGLGFNRAAPNHVLLRLLDAGSVGFLFRRDLPTVLVDAAIVHQDRRVLATIIESRILTAEQWDKLLAAVTDPALRRRLDVEAQQHAAVRAHTARKSAGTTDTTLTATPSEIAELASSVPDIEPGHSTHTLDWVEALHGDTEAMRLLASSPKLWIRRSIARAQQLPDDVVQRLARDEDGVVRLFLAESCDDAPAEMLLEVWSWWTGSLSVPDRPRNHPNFPRSGLLRYADDPNPRMRRLALDDPASTAQLVARFSCDPDPEVRADAAQDARLTADAAARLLTDTDSSVRHFAAQHPSLPRHLLVDLLLGQNTAAAAAQNPAIPTPVMRYMSKAMATE